MWLLILSDQLPIVALVGLYPTNELIGRGLILWHLAYAKLRSLPSLCGIVDDFSSVFLTSGQITHVLLTRPPLPPSEDRERSTCMCQARRQRLS